MALAVLASCGVLWSYCGWTQETPGPVAQAGGSEGSSSSPPTAPASRDEAAAFAGAIFGREIKLGICTGFVIPFMYPDRPTIEVAINGARRPLLFDTGTNHCLLQINDSWAEPPRLIRLDGAELLAELDGKCLRLGRGGTLEYAIAPLVGLGDLRLRQVPWRVYTVSGPGANYAGAFAPGLLREWIIEVNNTAGEIRLHDRRSWLPAQQAYVLPLLTLPRGIFTPLTLEGEQYWFHMDTGFSGGLGLAPSVRASHAASITAIEGTGEVYQGWHADYAYDELLLRRVGIPAYPGLRWAQPAPLVLDAVPGLAYRDAYRELEAYRIGGIAGSGFWQRFDYALDYELGRLYLWPREGWEDPVAAGA